MSLLTVIKPEHVESIRQLLLGALERLKEIISELRDETTIKIQIQFERKAKP